jgi:hypothetical protein
MKETVGKFSIVINVPPGKAKTHLVIQENHKDNLSKYKTWGQTDADMLPYM